MRIPKAFWKPDVFLAQLNNERGGAQLTAEDILFFNGLGDAIAKLYQFLIPTATNYRPFSCLLYAQFGGSSTRQYRTDHLQA